jgi:hypothetical protein
MRHAPSAFTDKETYARRKDSDQRKIFSRRVFSAQRADVETTKPYAAAQTTLNLFRVTARDFVVLSVSRDPIAHPAGWG